VLAAAYEQKGMYDTAIAEYKKGILQGSGASQLPLAGLGHVLAISGKKDEARVVLDQLKAQATKEYVPANNMALIYAGLGDKDQAFVWLEKAYDERAFALALGLKKDPRWDNLRSDPRYVELLRRMGLHQ
jgi:tetratricopeptide (TPR) repeat protein